MRRPIAAPNELNRTFLKRVAVALLVFFGLMAASAYAQGTSANEPVSVEMTETKTVLGVKIKEIDGEIMDAEVLLLRKLDSLMIPLPDSIEIHNHPTDRGWVTAFQPTLVNLSPRRLTHPNDTKVHWPYMLGRNPVVPSKVPAQVHILAHEIGHVLSPKFRADLARPALGLLPLTQEVEAEIIGLALMRLAFDLDLYHLGFPEKIKYADPGIPDQNVRVLRRQYCQIIKTTWQLTHLSCN